MLPEKTGPLTGPDENPFIRPVGQKLEIIPLTNPNRLQPGDTLAVRVLLEGKPAPGYGVSATSLYAPNSVPQKMVTDDKGEARFTITAFYGPWIVDATHSFPADGELAKKCRNIHYYTVNVVFVDRFSSFCLVRFQW